jgi:hypothetical protein
MLPERILNLGAIPGEKGVWELNYIENMADYIVGDRGRPAVRNAWGSRAEPQVPFMPWSAARYDYNLRNEAKYDPESFCRPPGGPRMFMAPYPMEVIQLPQQNRLFLILEVSHVWREIFMDGRAHPGAKEGAWLGHSVGRYEDGGKTLTIDVANFNEGTWLDFAGHVHTNLLHVIERFTRPSKNILHYEALIEDPGAYTRPFTIAWDMKWWPNGQLDEYVCEENNQYLSGLRDDSGRPVFPGK